MQYNEIRTSHFLDEEKSNIHSPHLFFIAGIILVSLIVILTVVFTNEQFQHGDNCGYMSLAKAVASGRGFVNPALPGSFHYLWWPPGFVLFLAACIKLFGEHWYFFTILICILFFTAILSFAHLLFIHHEKPIKILLVSLAVCFSSAIHLLSSYLYSETFYCACCLLFLYFFSLVKKKISLLTCILLSLGAVYIGSIRLIGIAMSMTVAMELFINRKRFQIPAWYGAIPILFLSVFLYLSITVPSLRVDSLRAVVGLDTQFQSAATGLHSYEPLTKNQLVHHWVHKSVQSFRGYGLTLIPQSMIRTIYDSFSMNKLKLLLMLSITLITFVGWVISFSKYECMNMFVFFSMLILCAYVPKYVRLVVPLVPFFFFYFYSGLEWLVRKIFSKNNIQKLAVPVLWIVVLTDNMHLVFTDTHRSMQPWFGDRQYQHCIEWITQHAQSSQTVVSQVNQYLYLRRGPFSLPFNNPQTMNEFITYCKQWNVQFFIISPFYEHDSHSYMDVVRKAIIHYPKSFTVVFGDPSLITKEGFFTSGVVQCTF